MAKTKREIKKVCDAIEEKKGADLSVLDVSKVSSFTDYFILCHGYNQRQNQAICDAVREKLKKEEGVSPAHVEGYESADWILMDYLSYVIHIFSPEARSFYRLERLWNDAERIRREALTA